MPHDSFSPDARLQWLAAKASACPFTATPLVEAVNTSIISERSAPGMKSSSFFPGCTKRTSPDKWHCSQMESRRRDWSFRGFTNFAWSVESPWQRAHCTPWTIFRNMLSVPGSVLALVAWQ